MIIKNKEPVAYPSTSFVTGIPMSGLVALWDAGIAASHPGTGTSLKNLVAAPADGSAQTAYDLTTSGLTFNGTAGRRSPGDFLQSNGASRALVAANTVFSNSLHKATAAFTLLCCVQVPSVGAYETLCSTRPPLANSIGISVFIAPSGALEFGVNNGSGYVILSTAPFGAITTGVPHFIALSFANGSGGRWCLDGASSTFATSYASPTASDAAQALMFSAQDTSSANPLPAGSRVFSTALWNRALSKEELDQAFDALRGRWPGL